MRDRPTSEGCALPELTPDFNWELAKLIYDELERIDPQPPDTPFEALGDFDKEMYHTVAARIFGIIKLRSRTSAETTS
jgi:hypothetical protein